MSAIRFYLCSFVYLLSLYIKENKALGCSLLCRYETSGNDDYSLHWMGGTRGRAEFLRKSTPKGKTWNSPQGKLWSSPKGNLWNSPKRLAWSDSPVRGIS